MTTTPNLNFSINDGTNYIFNHQPVEQFLPLVLPWFLVPLIL
jgi:hypothetical protein